MPRNKRGIGLFVRTLAVIAEDNPGKRPLENQVRWIP
jgi:hypothetical protein